MVDLQFKHYDYQKRRSYACRVPDIKWEAVRPVIDHMFQKGMTHSAILQQLEKHHNFKVSKGQLVDRLQKWSLSKYRPRLVKTGFDTAPVEGYDMRLSSCRTVFFDNLRSHIKIDIILPLLPGQNKYLHWKAEQQAMAKCFNDLIDDLFPFNLRRILLEPSTAAIPVNRLPNALYVSTGTFRSKDKSSPAQLRAFQGDVLHSLRIAFAKMTDLDRYDLGLFHVVLCLAAESILHADKDTFTKHRDMACYMLQGMLHYRGEGGDEIFGDAIRAFCYLEVMQVGNEGNPPHKWRENLFIGANHPGLHTSKDLGTIHGCVQYDCETVGS